LPDGAPADGAIPPDDGTGGTMDGGGGCSLRAPAATPFAALIVALAATVAFIRRRRK